MAAEIQPNIHSILHTLHETKQNYSTVVMVLISHVYLKQGDSGTICCTEEPQIPLLTSRFSQYLQQRNNTHLPIPETLAISTDEMPLRFESPKY